MALYAKIDRATGALLEYRELTSPVRSLNKAHVMLPVTRDAKPPFDEDTEQVTAAITQPDLSNLTIDVPSNASRVEGWTVSDRTLVRAKANRRAKVDALLAEKLDAGRSYGGNVYQLRLQDLANITAMRVALSVGEVNPHNGVWRSKANVDVAMNDTAFATFAVNILYYVRNLIRKGSAHKDGIDACANVAAVRAYDITTGWPANP